VRANSLWGAVLGVEKTVVEDVEFDEDQGCVVVHVRPVARQRGRCGRCGGVAEGMTRAAVSVAGGGRWIWG